MAATEAPDMMTEKERRKYEREKRLMTQNSLLDKSGSIHQFQTETKANALGGQSLEQFKESRSNHQLSQSRPYNTANHSTGEIPRSKDIYNHSQADGSPQNLDRSTFHSKDGKSVKSLKKSLSPDGRSAVNVEDQYTVKLS